MFSSGQIDQFKRLCSSFGLDLSSSMLEQFETYASLLLDWNNRIHLVSKGDAKSDRILRHFVDSLSIFKTVDIPQGAKLLDLGAGAGFPSIPVKIVRDDIRPVLVESIHKKALFLQKLCQVLELENVRVVNQRAEELQAETGLLASFDLVTAKALGKLSDIASLSAPFMKIGGLLVCYKGPTATSETSKAKLPPGLRIQDVVKTAIPEMDLVRWLVVVHRVS